jgi:shikimate dehydrogenase
VYDSSLTYRPIDLVVNTVPTDARRLEFAVMQGISPDSTAIDITYDPLESDWLRVYRKLGCATSNGLGMLAFQAAAQMNWWWGSEINGADLLKVIQ